MAKLKILKVLWVVAKALNTLWPEDSEWTDEKDLLVEVAQLLLEKAGFEVDFHEDVDEEDPPVHTMDIVGGYGKETIK